MAEYRYCPQCATALAERVEQEDGGLKSRLRCPACKVALWSHYAGAGPKIAFVRVGTLDTPDACPPDIHIFTASKQPWVVLPPGARAVPEYYDRDAEWPAESLARRARFSRMPARPQR